MSRALQQRSSPIVTVSPVNITDADDARLREYCSLTDPQLRMVFEPEHGLFIAEGELILQRALDAGCRVRSVLLDEKHVARVTQLLGQYESAWQDAPAIYTASYEVLENLTGFHVHRGVLASITRPAPRSWQSVAEEARTLAVVEDVNNHTNLGSLMRSAAALGIGGVLLSPTCVDPLYRRVIRVSMGQVFAIPFARLTPWPRGLYELCERGFTLIGLTPSQQAVDLRQLPSEARERPALLLGAEGPGLSASALKATQLHARIPMHHDVDSLNVAVAGAIACYELAVAPYPTSIPHV